MATTRKDPRTTKSHVPGGEASKSKTMKNPSSKIGVNAPRKKYPMVIVRSENDAK